MPVGNAQAGPVFTIVETQTLAPIIGNYPAVQIVSIPQFDPSNGTLLFAVVRITANYDALIQAENIGQSSAIISAMSTQTIQVTPPPFVAPMPLNDMQIIPLQSNPVAPFDGVLNFMGPSSTSFTYTPVNPREVLLADVTRDPMDVGFANFIGLGSFDFGINGLGEFTVSSNTGAVSAKANLAIGATIEVEYHYVPEPATLAILLPGLALIRRRRPR